MTRDIDDIWAPPMRGNGRPSSMSLWWTDTDKSRSRKGLMARMAKSLLPLRAACTPFPTAAVERDSFRGTVTVERRLDRRRWLADGTSRDVGLRSIEATPPSLPVLSRHV